MPSRGPWDPCAKVVIPVPVILPWVAAVVVSPRRGVAREMMREWELTPSVEGVVASSTSLAWGSWRLLPVYANMDGLTAVAVAVL